jgi:phosphate:Na+ symporter
MEIFADIFSGLGLFFIGIKGIGSNLKQMTGRRFRGLIAKATRNPASAAAVGAIVGVITQSTNAATFIVVSMVTAGLVEVRRALPIVAWANVGTSVLVLLATFDIHLAVLYLLGVVGFCYYFGLNEHDEFRHLVGALFGVGTLFLGLWLIKQGAAPLKDVEWVQAFLRYSADSFLLALGIGAALTLVVQSSATVSVIAVTMTAVGLLTLDQTLMIVLGANLGSGFSTYLMGGSLEGTGRQLALIQMWLKTIGVILLLPPFLGEVCCGLPGPKALSQQFGGDLTRQVAWVYLILQVVSAITASLFGGFLHALARRLSPPSRAEELARPRYLYEQAMEEVESALDLVEKEQTRLIRRLPRLFDELRLDEVEDTPIAARTLHRASTSVAGECAGFLARLTGHAESHHALERVMNLRSRNELLIHLQDGCLDLVNDLTGPFSEPAAENLRTNLVEGLCTVLLVLIDTVGSDADAEEHDLLLAISADRAALMERIRAGMLQAEAGLGADSQARLFAATSLFERLIWVVHRYALLLKRHAGLNGGERVGAALAATGGAE